MRRHNLRVLQQTKANLLRHGYTACACTLLLNTIQTQYPRLSHTYVALPLTGGGRLVPVHASLDQFSEVFLSRYVKPSNNQRAKNELPQLAQTSDMSVEIFAAQFRSVNSRIAVGSPID